MIQKEEEPAEGRRMFLIQIKFQRSILDDNLLQLRAKRLLLPPCSCFDLAASRAEIHFRSFEFSLFFCLEPIMRSSRLAYK